jgi:hypothetical protein
MEDSCDAFDQKSLLNQFANPDLEDEEEKATNFSSTFFSFKIRNFVIDL